MKLLALLTTIVAAVSVSAQRAVIFRPSNGDTFSPGQNVTVSVVRPNTLTGDTQLGVGIAIRSCGSGESPCPTDGFLGTLLYCGPYDPSFDSSTLNMPNQNFTVTIPEYFSYGRAMLSVAHASFFGASTGFLTEVLNVTLNLE